MKQMMEHQKQAVLQIIKEKARDTAHAIIL